MLGRLLVADVVAKTDYMMAQIKHDAINEQLKKWKEMIMDYHCNGYDSTGGEMDKTTRWLEDNGVDPEWMLDYEYSIMDKVYGDDC